MSELREELNKAYIKGLDNETDKFSYWVLEHLRMSGAYWGLTAMDLLSGLEEMSREDGIKFVTSCFHEETGGFSGNVGHDPHLLYTLSAVQIMCLFDALDQLDTDKIVSYILCYLFSLTSSFFVIFLNLITRKEFATGGRIVCR